MELCLAVAPSFALSALSAPSALFFISLFFPMLSLLFEPRGELEVDERPPNHQTVGIPHLALVRLGADLFQDTGFARVCPYPLLLIE